MPYPSDQRLPLELKPDSRLLRYYVVSSFVAGPFFFILLAVRFFRYRTLRYRIDEEGISMRWGVLSQREIVLNYARIQDIHLTSNVVERWLDLAKIRIQTASGSAKAEMVLEGLEDPAEMRDFLYSRMRGGAHGDDARPGPSDLDRGPEREDDALVAALEEVTGEIRALRTALSREPADDENPGEGGGTSHQIPGDDR